MITKERVEIRRKKQQAKELKGLDVDRVDGVDRPATGRNFLLFKREDLVREFPLEQPPTRTGPRAADQGSDELGRGYEDEAFDALAEWNGGDSAEPGLPAGAPPRFAEDQGGRLPSPPQAYTTAGPVKLPGGMRLLSPGNSGLRDAEDFRAPAPVAKGAGTLAPNMSPRGESVIAKRGSYGGLFTDLVLGPLAGTKRFSPAPVTERRVDETGGFGIVDEDGGA
jgi:hypothetical protein